MAYIFISDGGPEAEEYDNNYFSYDESNIEARAKIKNIIENCDTQDPQIRTKLIDICRESHRHPSTDKAPGYRFGWLGYVVNCFKPDTL